MRGATDSAHQLIANHDLFCLSDCTGFSEVKLTITVYSRIEFNPGLTSRIATQNLRLMIFHARDKKMIFLRLR